MIVFGVMIHMLLILKYYKRPISHYITWWYTSKYQHTFPSGTHRAGIIIWGKGTGSPLFKYIQFSRPNWSTSTLCFCATTVCLLWQFWAGVVVQVLQWQRDAHFGEGEMLHFGDAELVVKGESMYWIELHSCSSSTAANSNCNLMSTCNYCNTNAPSI